MAPTARASATSGVQHGNGIGARLLDHHPGGTIQTETGDHGVAGLHEGEVTWIRIYLAIEGTTMGVAAEMSVRGTTGDRRVLRETTDGKTGIGAHIAVVGRQITTELASAIAIARGNELRCIGDREHGNSPEMIGDRFILREMTSSRRILRGMTGGWCIRQETIDGKAGILGR